MSGELENVALTEQAIDNLPSEEARVIRMRYGLPPYSKTYTHQEIARHSSMLEQEVRAAEASALRRLRFMGGGGQ